MVGIYEVKEYQTEAINNALDKIFNDLDVKNKIKEGTNVVVKPDLTIGIEDKREITSTNYLLIKLVCQKVMKLGANVTICDKTDGIFNLQNIEDLYKKLNLNLFQDIGIKLNKNPDVRNVNLKYENETEVLQVIDCIKKADYIINMPKIKTHTAFGISASISNMLGTITTDSIKNLYGKYPDRSKLSKIAIMLANSFKNQIVIADSVVCMENNGPVNGTKIKLSNIIASDNIFEADYIITKKYVKDTALIPMFNEIVKFKGLEHFSNIEIKEESVKIKNLKLPLNLMKLRFSDKLSGKRVWPVIDDKKCIKCKICVIRCPMEVIHFEGHKVIMRDRYKCTKCMYCVDQCPTGAITLQKKKVKISKKLLNNVKKEDGVKNG